jgi:chemosensory pili system protein ChpB (putative protein-glutamate methylesterase)
MASAQNNRTVRAGLVYQALSLNEHLRVALGNAGVEVVAESLANNLANSNLDSAQIDVFVVNLDPDLEDHLDDLTELLDRTNRPVIFNDGAASSSLAGWDQARWARHLAAKIKGELDANPPRPEGAQAIPVVPVKAKVEAVTAAPLIAKTPEPVAPRSAAATGFSAAQEPAKTVEADPFAEMSEINLDFDQAPAQSFARADDTAAMDDFDASMFDLSSVADAPTAVSELDDLDALLNQAAPITADVATPQKVPERTLAATVELPVLTPAQLAEPASSLDWSLEPLDGEPVAVPTTGRAVFGAKDVEPVQATIATATVIDSIEPVSPNSGVPKDQSDGTDLNALDFFADLEIAAPAPSSPHIGSSAITSQQPTVGAQTQLSDLDAMFEDFSVPEAAVPTTQVSSAASISNAPSLAVAELDFDLDFEVGAPSATRTESVGATSAFENDDFAELDALFADPPAPAPSRTEKTAVVELHQSGPERVVVLGASIGGPEAVRSFLSKLKANTPVAFVLAQHMGAEFLELMTSQLSKASSIPVKLAKPGDSFKAGEVLVVPVNQRFVVDANSTVQFSSLPSESPYSPSIDQVLFDMSDRFGTRCGAIIFSGMASDAIEGAKYLAGRGGKVWVQDPATCVISSMIDGAQAAGVVSFVGAPEQLAEHLTSTLH